MSMIDCKINVGKKPDPNGDRVVLTFEYVILFFLRLRRMFTCAILSVKWKIPALRQVVNKRNICVILLPGLR
jgi:hypothetical protein